MKVKQLSVFVENKSGRLYDVAMALGKAGVNIRALSLADTLDFGVIRLIVDKVDVAVDTLKKAGFTVSETEVLALLVKDAPGGLADVLGAFSKNGIDIEYMYAFAGSKGADAVMIFRFDDTQKALTVLSSVQGIRILTSGELYSL
ncbi:MAG: amino acid-binding protein [Spirochaetes bacterium]|nr:amino acid-binding protein [Spirochaetota bacterium]